MIRGLKVPGAKTPAAVRDRSHFYLQDCGSGALLEWDTLNKRTAGAVSYGARMLNYRRNRCIIDNAPSKKLEKAFLTKKGGRQ